MVDKELNFLSKNRSYGIISKINPMQNIGHNIIYANGEALKYGDVAEIFGAITDNDLLSFFKSSITEEYISREHYGVEFGYQPADYENEELRENEIKIHYIEVENTVTKKSFYELCLLLCDAKLNGLDFQEDGEENKEELLQIKSQLVEKIKIYSV
jgi:hypothetical protein